MRSQEVGWPVAREGGLISCLESLSMYFFSIFVYQCIRYHVGKDLRNTAEYEQSRNLLTLIARYLLLYNPVLPVCVHEVCEI